MTSLLVKLFIKNHDDIHNQEVRQKYGMLGGGVGIFLNVLLFSLKFIAGLITSSISITADAFNNLSDAGSSVVTLIGFKMAGMPADSEHPFGHGRIEYISGLAVSMAIILMGVELIKSSVDKILHPEAVTFSLFSVVILLVSILAKGWMSLFNRGLGKRIGSTAMMATAMDSLSDCIATGAVVLGIGFSYFTHIIIDGYIGLVVALFVSYTGFTTARDSLSPLLGQAPDKEFVEEIRKIVLAHEDIEGIHDLIVHNYGPGRSMISLHAEVRCDADILAIHDTIDLIELELKHRFNCEATIHMDPIAVDDKVTQDLREKIVELLRSIDGQLSLHDFRMVQGLTHTNLIFDVVVPFKFRLTDEQVTQQVWDKVKQIDPNYNAVIKVERAYA